MNLTHAQKEYLLELLSSEYLPTEAYLPILRQAIQEYQTTDYTTEELDFLSSLPLSLTADLYLTHNQPFSHFASRFALWLNTIEYNMCDENPNALYLINPDPTSRAKIIRLEKANDTYTYRSAPPLYFHHDPRKAMTLAPTELSYQSPLCSIWDYSTVENLLQSFLNFAKQNPAKIPDTHQDYLFTLEDNLKRTKEKRFIWEELHQKALTMPTTEDDYVFLDRSQGLITPSTLQFISLINSKPVKTIIKRVAKPQAPLTPLVGENSFVSKLKNIFKNPPRAPQHMPHKRHNFTMPRPTINFAHPVVPKPHTAPGYPPQHHRTQTNHASFNHSTCKPTPTPNPTANENIAPRSSLSTVIADELTDIAAPTDILPVATETIYYTPIK